jgi:hypothetical protein
MEALQRPDGTKLRASPVAAAECLAPAAPALADLRFRALVGEEAWSQLPEPVQRRFSKCLAPGAMLLYRGQVVATKLSAGGRVLAFLARAVGSPLPLSDGATGPALVAVVEDGRLGGQNWTRIYARPGRLPQTIHSTKRFRGPTGLEEHVGCGIGMALQVTVEDGALCFRSRHYFVELGRLRLRLPRWMQPGNMLITHREEGAGTFSFSLSLTHPALGTLIHQLAYFCDT